MTNITISIQQLTHRLLRHIFILKTTKDSNIFVVTLLPLVTCSFSETSLFRTESLGGKLKGLKTFDNFIIFPALPSLLE